MGSNAKRQIGTREGSKILMEYLPREFSKVQGFDKLGSVFVLIYCPHAENPYSLSPLGLTSDDYT